MSKAVVDQSGDVPNLRLWLFRKGLQLRATRTWLPSSFHDLADHPRLHQTRPWRARSQAAFVWPGSRQPHHQAEAISGKNMSRADDGHPLLRQALLPPVTVLRAPVTAEIPVLTPTRLSIDTVKLVPNPELFALHHQRAKLQPLHSVPGS